MWGDEDADHDRVADGADHDGADEGADARLVDADRVGDRLVVGSEDVLPSQMGGSCYSMEMGHDVT